MLIKRRAQTVEQLARVESAIFEAHVVWEQNPTEGNFQKLSEAIEFLEGRTNNLARIDDRYHFDKNIAVFT